MDIGRHCQAGALVNPPPVIVLHVAAFGGDQGLVARQPVVRWREEIGVLFTHARSHARQILIHAIEQRSTNWSIHLQHFKIAGIDRSITVAGIGGDLEVVGAGIVRADEIVS